MLPLWNVRSTICLVVLFHHCFENLLCANYSSNSNRSELSEKYLMFGPQNDTFSSAPTGSYVN